MYPLAQRRFGHTSRREAWWLQPAAVFLGLSAFIVYATWAAFQGNHFEFGPYLSPFYSPLLFGDSHHAWLGPQPGWWPAAIPFSAALFILWAPGGFRLTCYYYRGAYYKAFWSDPPGCTVGEPRKSYWGERWFPLVLHNLHRYFLYIGIFFIVVLTADAVQGYFFADASGARHFGIGVGSLVLTLNAILLAGYTFGCHSLRHLVGGGRDEIATSSARWTCYSCVSGLNSRHQLFAWLSLGWVAFTDVYVRLCSMGIWMDHRIL